ncbi:beta-ketoacyl-[acyl-carrier-protein] synthase II [candidate division KSB1 bacterium]|nr:beta-ketoacyl-ACP synthase II [candidate division KSB1 bacterium]RQW06866.1 MAG: beta-ketoacyl-[acyl-carrier-protein] synthase II [candidate division KSB1 bacterium]
MELKRVVVTGLGAITPIGNNVDAYWDNLQKGTSGTGPLTLIDPEPHKTKIAAEVKDFDPTAFIDRKEARRMERFTHFAIVAADEAIADSGINFQNVDTDYFGAIVASGIGGMPTFEKQYENYLSGGPRKVSPFFIPMLIADISAGYISIKHGLKGINYCTTSACASASHAIGEAFNSIRFGRAIGMLAGGSEASTTVMGVSGFNALQALSTRNDSPETASRPFDLHRDGFIMGEGAAILVLEELGHARARGARIYGEIVGVGFTADAYHITAPIPGGDGAMRAMNIAIKDAGIEPSDIDYINAHGTSTVYNDKVETEAIKKAFGEHAYHLYISSTKSMVGHLLGASGAVESVATLLGLEQGIIHPTINYETPDPECDLNYVPNKAIKKDFTYALSNSFGFGGHNVCLAFKKYIE